jgi:hypothetical protein
MEENPTIEPIDKSIPPVRITTDIPVARIPIKLAWVRRFTRFLGVRNKGDIIAEATTSIIKTINNPYRFSISLH